ncbi:MAG: ABC transporter permease [Verrucomicrobiota bacterium]
MNFLADTWVGAWLEGLGRITLLTKETLTSLLRGRIDSRDLLYQLYFMGVKSQSVVLITGAFTGMVLGAQTFFQFHKVKMDTATLAVVSVSMCSELGPVLTALMVAGRVGAAIAAELGTMRVTEQIDALRTLATDLGIGAGYIVGVHLLGIDPTYSWYNMLRYTQTGDVAVGLIKAFIYGGIVAMVGCYKGMTCGEGAEGVGRATTESVVYSSITILIANFFLTLSLGTIFHSL